MMIFTYGYGWLEVKDDEEEYSHVKGYNDAKLEDGPEIIVDDDTCDSIVEVRERADGSLFAVIEMR